MSFPPLLNGPIPPYNNPPIMPQYFMPRQFYISNIQLGQTTIITTILNMNYVIGQLVRLLIPYFSGSRELNELEGYVISIPSLNQVEVDICSVNFSPFLTSTAQQQPQIVAIGDVNTGMINANGRTFPVGVIPGIPGSFQNISPF
jgi:hypothetical protein